MPYRIYYHDPGAKDGYVSGQINDQVAVEVVQGQGRPFVQLEDRQGEVYIAVSNIYKIEKAGQAAQRPASAYSS